MAKRAKFDSKRLRKDVINVRNLPDDDGDTAPLLAEIKRLVGKAERKFGFVDLQVDLTITTYQ